MSLPNGWNLGNKSPDVPTNKIEQDVSGKVSDPKPINEEDIWYQKREPNSLLDTDYTKMNKDQLKQFVAKLSAERNKLFNSFLFMNPDAPGYMEIKEQLNKLQDFEKKVAAFKPSKKKKRSGLADSVRKAKDLKDFFKDGIDDPRERIALYEKKRKTPENTQILEALKERLAQDEAAPPPADEFEQLEQDVMSKVDDYLKEIGFEDLMELMTSKSGRPRSIVLEELNGLKELKGDDDSFDYYDDMIAELEEELKTSPEEDVEVKQRQRANDFLRHLVDDTKEMHPQIEEYVDNKMPIKSYGSSEALSPMGATRLKNYVKNSLKILGMSPEVLDRVLPNGIEIGKDPNLGYDGVYSKLQRKIHYNFGETALRRKMPTVLHELGHAFQRKRVISNYEDAWVKANAIEQKMHFHKDPHGRAAGNYWKVKLPGTNAYTGRCYAPSNDPDPKTAFMESKEFREVFTTGIQEFTNPQDLIAFIKNNPSQFKLIIGLLKVLKDES